jgi:Cephalosporin hydroxylase
MQLLNLIHPKYIIRKWGTTPLNGQYLRQQTLVKIAASVKPTHVIETGTYFAGSTGFLSTLTNGRCITIESNPKFYEVAKENIDFNYSEQNIEIILGRSEDELSNVLQKIEKNSRLIVYLDAHWYENVPIERELEALDSWGGSWIAIIDDFKVPTDSGYGFDVYGKIEIGPKVIPKDFSTKGIRLFVPKKSSYCETGRRKGTGYLFSKKSIKITQNYVFEDLEEIILREQLSS